MAQTSCVCAAARCAAACLCGCVRTFHAALRSQNNTARRNLKSHSASLNAYHFRRATSHRLWERSRFGWLSYPSQWGVPFAPDLCDRVPILRRHVGSQKTSAPWFPVLGCEKANAFWVPKLHRKTGTRSPKSGVNGSPKSGDERWSRLLHICGSAFQFCGVILVPKKRRSLRSTIL